MVETLVSISVPLHGSQITIPISRVLHTPRTMFSRYLKNLGSASLSEIEVEAYYYSYDEMGICTSGTETLTLKADWTGVGELNERSSKYSVEDGDYTSKVSESYLSRGAKATGSINGINLGDSSYAWLSSSTRTYMSREK